MMWKWIPRIFALPHQPLEHPQPLLSKHEVIVDENTRKIQKAADDVLNRARQRITEKQSNPRGIGRE